MSRHQHQPEHRREHDLPWWAHDTPTGTPSPAPTAPSTRTRRARTWRRRLAAVATTAVLATGLTLTLTGADQPEVRAIDLPGGTERRQTTQALIAGCGGVYEFTDVLDETHTIPATRPDGRPNLARWRTIVPMFGPMWDEPAPTTKRAWATTDPDIPTPEALLHNQWQGWLIAYYTDGARKQDVASLKTLATTRPDLQMLTVPWPKRLGALPYDRTIALTTWANSQTCTRLNAAAIADFRDLHPADEAPGTDGTPPPTGHRHR